MLHNAACDGYVGMRMTGRLGKALYSIRLDWFAAVLAVILSAFIVAGASFQATNSSAWFSSSPAALLGSVVAALLIAVVLYLALWLILAAIDRSWAAGGRLPAERSVMTMRAAISRWLIPTWAVLLAGWLPWLLIHYPGNVDSDTITQMFQWLGLIRRTNGHPWFDTMVFGWFWDLGAALGSYTYGLFLILLIQEVATALGFAFAVTYLRRLGLSKPVHWVLTVFLAAFPVFFITPSVLSKDSFAGVFWTPFVVLFIEALRTRGRVLTRWRVGAPAVLLTILLIFTERPMFYIVVLCVLALLLVAAKGTRWKVIAGTALAILITNIIWPLMVLPAWGVKPGTATDMLTVPLQQTARTVKLHGDELPSSERTAIDAVLRYKGLAKAYVPTRSDAVKGRWNSAATTEQKLTYFKVWLSELFRYPGTYLAATFNNTFECFAPVARINFQTSLSLAHYNDYWHSRAIKGTTYQQITDVSGQIHPPRQLLNAQAAFNRDTVVFTTGNLLGSKALYCSWIPLLALVVGLRKRSWLHVLATLPVFLNLAVLVAGPITLPRYMIPSIYGSVVVLGFSLLPVRWESRSREVAVVSPSGGPEELADVTDGSSGVEAERTE